MRHRRKFSEEFKREAVDLTRHPVHFEATGQIHATIRITAHPPDVRQ